MLTVRVVWEFKAMWIQSKRARRRAIVVGVVIVIVFVLVMLHFASDVSCNVFVRRSVVESVFVHDIYVFSIVFFCVYFILHFMPGAFVCVWICDVVTTL